MYIYKVHVHVYTHTFKTLAHTPLDKAMSPSDDTCNTQGRKLDAIWYQPHLLHAPSSACIHLCLAGYLYMVHAQQRSLFSPDLYVGLLMFEDMHLYTDDLWGKHAPATGYTNDPELPTT